jgi:hypothetical protein
VRTTSRNGGEQRSLECPSQSDPGSIPLWCSLFGVCGNTVTCVFDEISPSLSRITLDINSEASVWCMAHAKGLSSLVLARISVGVSSRFVIPPSGGLFQSILDLQFFLI